MSHLFFIAASYAVAVLGLGGLTAWSILAYRREQRALSALEARGIRRRSRAAAAGDQATGEGASSGNPMGVK